MRVGRIPYVNCYPVYGAIDRRIVPLDANLVDGVPTALNREMAGGSLDVSVVSAVEYARNATRYLLLPDLAISCDGPVRSVALFSRRPAEELDGRRVVVSRSSMTSAALLELLFEHVWHARPQYVPGDAELSDLGRFDAEPHRARSPGPRSDGSGSSGSQGSGPARRPARARPFGSRSPPPARDAPHRARTRRHPSRRMGTPASAHPHRGGVAGP
jgi:hypothetical protein